MNITLFDDEFPKAFIDYAKASVDETATMFHAAMETIHEGTFEELNSQLAGEGLSELVAGFSVWSIAKEDFNGRPLLRLSNESLAEVYGALFSAFNVSDEDIGPCFDSEKNVYLIQELFVDTFGLI